MTFEKLLQKLKRNLARNSPKLFTLPTLILTVAGPLVID
jgi:hypothetical protein